MWFCYTFSRSLKQKLVLLTFASNLETEQETSLTMSICHIITFTNILNTIIVKLCNTNWVASCKNGTCAICSQHSSRQVCAFAQCCHFCPWNHQTLHDFITDRVSPDQSVRMRRLVCSYVGRIWHKTNFCMTHLKWCIYLWISYKFQQLVLGD